MIKKIIFTTTTLLLMSGCVTKEVVYQPATPMATEQEAVYNPPLLKTHAFAGEELTATPEVSQLIYELEALQKNNTAYVDLNSNQNVQVGAFLNISATPNQSGYLKVVIIDPNGSKSLVIPNLNYNGYLTANESFYSNNDSFALKATKPIGLHYVVIIFSEQNAPLAVRQGMNGYDGLNNNQDFITILQSINNQNYGKSYISVFPMRIY